MFDYYIVTFTYNIIYRILISKWCNVRWPLGCDAEPGECETALEFASDDAIVKCVDFSSDL